ncbi:Uncharacterised protein [Vibrio cholerae]|nr:Uncharacterised protein [Vibrio cholerae]CSC34306.1 Uncharacterised protein [Vibrio cholerae]CSD00535.1 Uncharacterised protein [Vibrio cholerae]CSD22754.1 Uncharacterised protein [Vibrio cholerae]CSI31265.1 Uncharacterised protein [Vibrio cholerae]
MSQHHKIQRWEGFAAKACEIRHESTGDLTRAVSTVVHEQQGIAILHRGRFLTRCADFGCFHKLIVFFTSVSRLQCFNR